MLPRNAWLALLACLLASLAGCAPIGFGEQELTLRHDAKADALDLLIVYEAIQANQEDAQISRGFATRVSGGHREFMIFDWPLHFDLDDLQGKVEAQAEHDADRWRELERELAGSLEGIRVATSGYFRGESGRLGLFQCLRISDAAHWLAMFERALYIGIEDSVAKGSFESDFEVLDARTRELWIAMAKKKQSWLSLKDGVLSVDLPGTGICASRALGEISKSAAEKTDTARFLAGLVSHLTEVKIADEHVVLRWKLDGPTWTFPPDKDHHYEGGLAQLLRDSNGLPATLPARSEVVERFSHH